MDQWYIFRVGGQSNSLREKLINTLKVINLINLIRSYFNKLFIEKKN